MPYIMPTRRVQQRNPNLYRANFLRGESVKRVANPRVVKTVARQLNPTR